LKLIFRATVLLAKKGRSSLTPGESYLYLASDKFPKHFIHDVIIGLRVLYVFTPVPVFWALYGQVSVRWIFQAELMDLNLGSVSITADQVPALNPIIIMLFIPVFDKVIYPGIEKFVHFGPLPRMAVGMFLLAASFVVSAFVQIAINDSNQLLNVSWQIPQYFLYSIGEVMTSITGLEFSYTQAPKSMKSLMMAGWIFATAVGNYLSAVVAISPLSDEDNYFLYAGIMVIFTFVFMAIAYTYKSTRNEADLEILQTDSELKTSGESTVTTGTIAPPEKL